LAFFLLKLIAPRKTFHLDMTEAERQLLAVHGLYWREMLSKGKAVVFGPVIDPDGSWGLGILEVEDEAEAHRLSENDPVIKAGRGFRYEFFPMPTLVSRA
jgi:uncharacterized protein YciI